MFRNFYVVLLFSYEVCYLHLSGLGTTSRRERVRFRVVSRENGDLQKMNKEDSKEVTLPWKTLSHNTVLNLTELHSLNSLIQKTKQNDTFINDLW